MVWDTPKAQRTELNPLMSSRRLPGLKFAGDMLAPQPDGVKVPALLSMHPALLMSSKVSVRIITAKT